MPLLSQLLALDSLSLVVVVPPASDPDVTWAATSELADPTPYLEGGELLLTTGLGTAQWRAEWDGFVARLAGAGVLAIGFGTGLTHTEVPHQLEAAARMHGLALLDVPRKTPFIAIGRALADLLAESERTALIDALAAQRELTRAVARGPREVLDRLARILGGAAAVLDADGGVVMGGGPDLPDAVGTRLARIRSLGLRGSAADLTPGASLIVQPLGLAGTPGRYLAVAADGTWSAAQRSAITIAVALLSLDAERATDRRELVRRVAAGIVALVLGGQPDAAATLLPVVSPAGALPDRIRVVRCIPSADPSDLLRLVEKDDSGGDVSVACLIDGEVVVLAAAGQSERLDAALAATGARVGVGSEVRLTDAASGDASARAALAQASGNRALVRFDEIATSGVGAALGPDARLAFALATLAPVLSAEAETETLLATARAFLTHNGARQPTALALGVHRNTLASRIDRLELLLSRSLDDPQFRADLWVALQSAPTGSAGTARR